MTNYIFLKKSNTKAFRGALEDQNYVAKAAYHIFH